MHENDEQTALKGEYMKYGNKKRTCNYGHVHDSVKEADRCNELHLMQRAGFINGLEIQKRFELIPSAKYREMPNERSCDYVADFVYNENGATVIEDTKGFRTKDFVVKRKLFKYRYCREGRVIFKET